AAARRLLRYSHRDGDPRGANQRDALDDYRLLPYARPGGEGGREMSKLLLSRRKLLGVGAASASSLILAGCDQFDFLGRRDDPVRDFLEGANDLTYAVQRGLIGDQVLAREYSESEIRQGQRPNGSTNPAETNPEYMFLQNGNFALYRLKVTGLVERELEFSLTEL